MNRKYLILILLLSRIMPIAAQQAQDFIFKHVTVNDGLLSNTVYCTLQDKKGLWWIGTDNGLQRWDGYRFINYQYKSNDSNSLVSDEIFGLLEDDQENIWIAHSVGVTRYNRKTARFTRVNTDLPYQDVVNSFTRDDEGTIWLAGQATGLRYYDTRQNKFVSYENKWAKSKEQILFIGQQKNSPYYWLGTPQGLICYDKKNRQYYSRNQHPKGFSVLDDSLVQNIFSALYVDDNNSLWFTNWPIQLKPYTPRFYKYDLDKDSLTHITRYLGEAKTLVTDQFDRVWFGGGFVSYYDKRTQKIQVIPKKENNVTGIDYDILFQLNKDRMGNIWVASDNGIFIFDPGPKSISIYKADTSFAHETQDVISVTSFLEYDPNNIWVTTWGRGAFLYDSLFRIKKRIFQEGDYLKVMAWCATKSKDGHVWMGWQEGVVYEHDPVSNKTIQYRPDVIRKKTVRQIVCDADGNIWLGTQKGILAYYDINKKTFNRVWDQEADGKINGSIKSMLLDSKQRLWIGTSHNGLFEFDTKAKSIVRHITDTSATKNGMLFNSISDMKFLDDSTLLLVCLGGVEVFNTRSEHHTLFSYPGIRTNNIAAVEKGAGNLLYMAGPNGLFQITMPQLHVYQYGQADGLQFNNYSSNAHIRLSNGLICFGTARNFITIREASNTHKAHPQAIISGIRIMNRALSVDSLESLHRAIELTYDRNYVAFDFACPEALLKPDNIFQYKMEGFDKDWKISDRYPTTEYSNLPPGHYRFLLKYRNTDGHESSVSTAIALVIHPPFWKRWWFLALVTILAFCFLYLLHRLRINRLLAMEKVRVHISRDLHDDMGSTLSSINILSVMSNKTLEKEPYKTKEYLVRISEYSQRMMETMDDIVWSINPLNDTMQKIVARMREMAATILEPKNIEYRFYVDEQVEHLKLDMGKRRELFLIFKEALNNMAKYSECTRAIIHITSKKKRLLMHIEDNGVGFDETILNDGNGLINMRKRAEDLGGRLTIHSVKGQGTEVTLNIPVA